MITRHDINKKKVLKIFKKNRIINVSKGSFIFRRQQVVSKHHQNFSLV